MIKIFLFLFLLSSLSPFLNAQALAGKLISTDGYPLSNLKVDIYSYPMVYTTSSKRDGSFEVQELTYTYQEIIPSEYFISENYPNPFNPKTRINIGLPKTSRILVELFNTLGQRINFSVDKEFGPGNNFIDIELNGLCNGIYFAKITIDQKYTAVRKLLLLYGTQHLTSTPSRVQYSLKKRSTIVIDSLIVSWSITGKKVFTSLPIVDETSSNIGNLVVEIDTSCPEKLCFGNRLYNVIRIGEQFWLKENLNIGTHIFSNSVMSNNSLIEKYCYDNDTLNCLKFGGLYQWDEAVQYNQGEDICPFGWHIPSMEEFQNLANTVNRDGNSLKAIGQGNGLGTGNNQSGFSSLLAGFKEPQGQYFFINNYAYYWTSTSDKEAAEAKYLSLGYNDSIIYFSSYSKKYAQSIRCIRDKQNISEKPGLLFPSFNLTGVNTSTQLTWETLKDANSYCIEVSQDTAFENLYTHQENIQDSHFSISGLEYSTIYYWRVAARNNYGLSEWSTSGKFTTRSGIPLKPVLHQPDSNSVKVETPVLLTWENSEEASTYELLLSTRSNFQTLFLHKDSINLDNYTVSNLLHASTYYWKIRAINSYGPSEWSNTWSFTTGSGNCPSLATISYEGRTYNTVQIGNQCWLKENLNIGRMIKYSEQQSDNGVIEKSCYEDNPANCETYGGLYQLHEALQYNDTKSLCPEGWHIPSSYEFRVLSNTVNNNGNSLKEAGHGRFSGIGTNISGFSALFKDNGQTSDFWSTSRGINGWRTEPYILRLGGNDNIIHIWFENNNDNYYYGIRCLRNDPPPAPDLISPKNNTGFLSTSIILTWEDQIAVSSYELEVANDGNFIDLTARFDSLKSTKQEILNLHTSQSYFWRVRSINKYGTSPWSKVNKFITAKDGQSGKVCPSVASITYGGKVYNTVQIGNQCWLRENLDIGDQFINKFCYDNNKTNCEKYGGLYTWAEAMKYTTQEGVRGICPEGWHIPSSSELKTLKEFIFDDGSSLKDLSAGGNNSTGLSMLNSGLKLPDNYYMNLDKSSTIWTSTQYDKNNAEYLTISDTLFIWNTDKRCARSVRCLKD